MKTILKEEYEQPFCMINIDVNKYPHIIKKVDSIFSNEKTRWKRILYMYIINLIKFGKVAIPRAHSYFVDNKSNWYTQRLANNVENLLISKGYITIKIGKKRYLDKKGTSSVISKTAKFDKTFANLKIKEIFVNLEDHNHLLINGRPYNGDNIEEDWNRYLKNQPFAINLERNYIVNTFYKTQELNKNYFSKIHLTLKNNLNKNLLTNVFLTRIYSKDECGRFTQRGGYNYQNIKKEYRKKLLINGKSTIELDFSNMFLNLLYSSNKIQAPLDDSYSKIMYSLINKKDLEFRKAIKKCVNIAINVKNQKAFVGALVNPKREKDKKTYEILKRYSIRPKEVLNKICESHPKVKSYLLKEQGLKLMKIESDIMQDILFKLSIIDVLALPLHDSIICQKGNEEIVETIMKNVYRKHTGFEIEVKQK